MHGRHSLSTQPSLWASLWAQASLACCLTDMVGLKPGLVCSGLMAHVQNDLAAEPALTVRSQGTLCTAATLHCLAGRKLALLSSCAVAAVFGIASSLSPGYW